MGITWVSTRATMLLLSEVDRPLKAPVSGTYALTVIDDDGVRLFLQWHQSH